MTRLLLIRHGESKVTLERRIGGPRTCSGLSPEGAAQARALADRFRSRAGPRPDVLYASTMLRAVETAASLAAVWDLPITEVDDLREHDPGPEADGMTFEDYEARYGAADDWADDRYLRGFEGGETVAAFYYRTALAAHRVVADHPGQTIMMVCHGGVIDIILRDFLGLPPVGAFHLFTANTSITELHRPSVEQGEPLGLWRLVRYNDAAHLEELATGEQPGGS